MKPSLLRHSKTYHSELVHEQINKLFILSFVSPGSSLQLAIVVCFVVGLFICYSFIRFSIFILALTAIFVIVASKTKTIPESFINYFIEIIMGSNRIVTRWAPCIKDDTRGVVVLRALFV